jgi:serine/threonine protein kinase
VPTTPNGNEITTCPERDLLIALAEGALSEQQVTALDEHLTGCPDCESTLAALEDDSDTLVRSLASLPATSDDELAFQQLHQRLLASPERFLGKFSDDPTEFFDRAFPLDLVLPFQLGNYDLIEQIGAGAHGVVFRGRHRRLDRPVAVKLLLHAAKSAIDDFLNEMRVIGRLDHPHIIHATDAGDLHGLHFLVMEYVAGLDVSTLLQREGSLTIPDACEIARQAALGLAFAHQHDLVHRDVKTSNLLFTAAGQVKLLDLGLAKISSSTPADGASANLPRGTADYMAPEQWLESDAVDLRADLYSLGCTLHKLLTGEPPYRRLPTDCRTKREAHLEAPIPSIRQRRPEVPPQLDRLIRRLMAKSPEGRPPRAEQVADELKQFTGGAELTALAQRLFPGEAHSRSGLHSNIRPKGRWVTRRNILAAGALSFGAAMLLPQLIRRRTGIAVNQWRPVEPSKPKLLAIPGALGAELTERAPSEFELNSPGLAYIHLGKPLRGTFRIHTKIQRESWTRGDAGLFLRLRLEHPAPDSEFSFQTLQIRSEDGQFSLVWLAHWVPPSDAEPVPLAAANIQPITAKRAVRLDVAVGRVGFPEVWINDHAYPKTSWKVTREGRDFSVINQEQLKVAFAGRIGLFHEGGRTVFGPSRLMYFDA